MKLAFTKMHGLGNDFVILDFSKKSIPITQAQAAKIADRHFGVGCDQILIVEASDREGIDFKYRILNADGGEVEQCGNGARCFAVFVRDQGLTAKSEIHVETLGGDIVLQADAQSGLVTVNMGLPNFSPADIPLAADQQQNRYQIALKQEEQGKQEQQETVEFAGVSMGNPHAVITVEDIRGGELERLGARLESHAMFPQRANIGFMQIVDRKNIKLRVYERGVGETIACGTGACAAAVCGIASGQLDNTVCVQLSGGALEISWQGDGHPVMMTGPTETVFHGKLELEI